MAGSNTGRTTSRGSSSIGGRSKVCIERRGVFAVLALALLQCEDKGNRTTRCEMDDTTTLRWVEDLEPFEHRQVKA